MDDPAYKIIVTSSAARSIQEELPHNIAVAVVEFITGPLLNNPQRLGKELRNELAGIWSARKGTYRVLYRINNSKKEVIILKVSHRKDVYRLN